MDLAKYINQHLSGFFNPADLTGPLRYWDRQKVEAAALKIKKDLKPAQSKDHTKRIGMFLVDLQDTFCLQTCNQLYVPGTERMLQNFIPWFMRWSPSITKVWATADTHVLYQIFHKYVYRNPQGDWAKEMETMGISSPYRHIFDEMVAREYRNELQRQNQAPLMIWPAHSLLMEKGHTMVTSLFEAICLRDLILDDQTIFRTKGLSLFSEAYGAGSDNVIEVKVSGGPYQIGQEYPDLMDACDDVDIMFIAGVARDFCVDATLKQLYAKTAKKDPRFIKKLHVLSDATESVFPDGLKVAGVKVTPSTTDIYNEYRSMGINVLTMAEANQLFL